MVKRRKFVQRVVPQNAEEIDTSVPSEKKTNQGRVKRGHLIGLILPHQLPLSYQGNQKKLVDATFKIVQMSSTKLPYFGRPISLDSCPCKSGR